MSIPNSSSRFTPSEVTPFVETEGVIRNTHPNNDSIETTSGRFSTTSESSLSIGNPSNIVQVFNTPVLPENNEYNYATNILHRPTTKPFTPTYMNIKDAVTLIPIFNGENMPVNNFIELCKQTEKLIHPSGKLYLTQLIKSRIQGKASRYVSSESELTFEEVLNNLKIALAPRRTLSQWQSLLSNIYQFEGESIVDYATRVKEIVQGTSETIIDKHSGEIRTGLLASTREGARDSFVRGLKGQLGLWVPGQKPPTLSRAIDLALEFEKELEQRDSLFNTHSHNIVVNNPANSTNFTGGYHGGRKNNNYHKPTQTSTFKSHPAVAAIHVAQTSNSENLRKLDRKSIICYRCGCRGHFRKECQVPHVHCEVCGRRSHTTLICKFRTSNTTYGPNRNQTAITNGNDLNNSSNQFNKLETEQLTPQIEASVKLAESSHVTPPCITITSDELLKMQKY